VAATERSLVPSVTRSVALLNVLPGVEVVAAASVEASAATTTARRGAARERDTRTGAIREFGERTVTGDMFVARLGKCDDA
jgi:hypothetical protein